MTTSAPPKTAIVTIVSNNYLHFARTMLGSAKQHHPEYALYCVVVDRDLGHATAFSTEFEVISIDKLALPLAEEFLFQYNILELNTAVKPWAIEYLFTQGHKNVIYVDPDIYFYGRMVEVEQLLSANTDIVLTPHLLAPVADDKQPRELDIRRAGAYNFGFCALRDSPNTRNFISWWQSKLTRDCVNDANRGLFVDQSWIDLVPGLFNNVGILRHKGYNVAYWNIAQRPLTKRSEGKYFIDQDALIFFHFSGLNPSDPAAFSKHQDRFTLSTVGPAKDLVDGYVKAVMANGYASFGKLEYGFGNFSNGEKIPDIFRKLYRDSSALRERMGPQPFGRFLAICGLWPEIAIDGKSPTNAMMALWNVRHDVRAEFPLTTADSIMGYYRWFVVFPPGAQHFSANVIAHHASVVKGFDAQLKAQAATSAKLKAHGWLGNERRAHHLYGQLLNRTPDESGFAVYSEMCKTDAGFVRAWGEIGLSEESKEKRFLWLRMLKALLISIYQVDRRAAEIVDQIRPIQAAQATRIFEGLFPVEADVAIEGIWVTNRVVANINARPGDTIRLEGIYFPESIEKQTGSPESTIRFLLCDEEIHATQLKMHGSFAIECVIPASYSAGPASLTLESSKVFVPKSIGRGDDERKLAWRILRLSVGESQILDCTNEKTFSAPDGSAPHDVASTDATAAATFKLAYSGFFQADTDSEELGVWVSANVVIPIVPIKGEIIRLRGAYFPESIKKQTGNAESTLCFFMAGKQIHRAVLSEDGQFNIAFSLPELNESDGDQIHIQCSKSFVKKDIGEGEDDRILSWRMKLLTAGRITVFDCARQNIATSNRRFVPRMTHTPNFAGSPVKLFAFYLPQFSRLPRDSAWRTGTIADWADVSNATAQYPDHHQPQLPIELGFYDYRTTGVLKKQVALAKQYGIAGFCFHHYWRPETQSVDQPLDRFLADPSLDVEFCVYWDNQNAAGREDQTSLPSLPSNRDTAFIDCLANAFADSRYRTIDQKPIVIVANPSVLLDAVNTIALWRKHAAQLGLPGLYLIAGLCEDINDAIRAAFDAVIAVPPLGYGNSSDDISSEIKPINQMIAVRIQDYSAFAESQLAVHKYDLASFEAVMPSWDSEALLPGSGISFAGATPEMYAKWLSKVMGATGKKRPEEQLLFINAWNAWSVGAHLEPDQRYGYGCLHATASALLNGVPAQNVSAIEAINRSFTKRSAAVLIVHIHYEDLIDPIFDSYLTPLAAEFDLIVTVSNDIALNALNKIVAKFKNCFIVQTPNWGRDIRPFVIAFRIAQKLGYLFACKIHTKKSLHRPDGGKWRTQLLDSLLRPEGKAATILRQFESRPSLGLLAPSGSVLDLSRPETHLGNMPWLDRLLTRLKKATMIGTYPVLFPAGSMYWVRISAVSQLLDDSFVSIAEFESEGGQVDGTLAHAAERMIGLLVICNNYEISEIDS